MNCSPRGPLLCGPNARSPATVRTYEDAVRMFLRFLAEEGPPAELTKSNVIAFLASLSEHASVHRSRTRLAASSGSPAGWQAEEGFDADRACAVRPPEATQKRRRRVHQGRVAPTDEGVRGSRHA